MKLFHFSENPSIERFEPKPVDVPSPRPPGQDWLNGPIVWAIDEAHQPLYLLPRDCPRIVIWPTAWTSAEDRELWWGRRSCRFLVHIEWAWFDALLRTVLYRYQLPVEAFQALGDAGMWVSKSTVDPINVERIEDLPRALAEQQVELRVMDSLVALKDVWGSTMHASGIRLRNARGWPESG